jgi:hypothetical protein
MVDEDPAHHRRGEPEEVRAIAPGEPLLSGQAQVGLVDEGRRLQRVPLALAAQLRRGEPLELAVDQREELLVGRGFASPPGLQELGDGQSFVGARFVGQSEPRFLGECTRARSLCESLRP